MDSGLVRLLIVAALFLLLAGDYGYLVEQVKGVLAPEEPPPAEEVHAVKSVEEDLDFKEVGAGYLCLNESDSIVIYVIKATRRKPANVFVDGELSLKSTKGRAAKAQLLSTMKNSCLPKLICELNASPEKDKLSDSEKALLSLISDTTMSTTAEVTSKYHFAAHMGQLIAGVDGAGCHNFYPSCPFPGTQVLNMIKSVRLRPPS